MKLFQIEEPEGSPLAQEGPGAAVGIELSPQKGAAVAVSIGGNAELLPGTDGTRRLPPAPLPHDAAGLTQLLLALRARAEKALLRPVTHAVVVLSAVALDGRVLDAVAPQAGLALLRVIDGAGDGAGDGDADAAVLAAAVLAEDEAMRLPPR